MVTNKENKGQMIFGLIVGILFILFGFIQLIVGLGFSSEITDAMFIPADIIGAFLLLTTILKKQVLDPLHKFDLTLSISFNDLDWLSGLSRLYYL